MYNSTSHESESKRNGWYVVIGITEMAGFQNAVGILRVPTTMQGEHPSFMLREVQMTDVMAVTTNGDDRSLPL